MTDERCARTRRAERTLLVSLLTASAILFGACQKKDLSDSSAAEVVQQAQAGEAAKPFDRRGDDLLDSARFGRLDKVEQLIAEGINVDARDLHEDTPLILASFHGHLNVVQTLLAKGADPNARNLTGSTALIEAAAVNQYEVVQELLRRGANAEAKNVTGLTALEVARRKKHSAVVSLLTDGTQMLGSPAGVTQAVPPSLVDINSFTQSGMTPLMTAAARGDAAAAEALLAGGANPNLATPHSGETALMMAVKGGHSGAVRALLKGGANPNLKDSAGDTCLTFAQQTGNVTIGRLLREAGAVAPTYNQVLPLY